MLTTFAIFFFICEVELTYPFTEVEFLFLTLAAVVLDYSMWRWSGN